MGATDSLDGNAKHRNEIWALIGPAEDTTANIVVTFSAQIESAVLGGVSFTGVDQTSATGIYVGQGGGDVGEVPSVNVSAINGDRIFDVFSTRSKDGPSTAGTGQTEIWNIDRLW